MTPRRNDLRRRLAALCCGVAGLLGPEAGAQGGAVSAAAWPGSDREAVGRLAGLAAPAHALEPHAVLLRSLGGALAPGLDSVRFRWVLPELRQRRNSALPWEGNDGPLRAGRGQQTLLTGGVAARMGRVSVVLVPQWLAEDNLAYQVIPYDQRRTPRRSVWANPFHPLPESIDLPLRFGEAPRQALGLGQSRLAIDLTTDARIGASTESRWWGPGVRNALLLSSHAGGVPHLFAESRRPWETRLGAFAGQYLLGRLRESPYFDADPANDVRSLSAFALTWRPPGDSAQRWPTLGVARGVMAVGGPRLGTVLDAWRDVGRPVSDPADIARRGGRDQVTSLFARWVLPEAGAEAWLEWARMELPASLRDWMEFPGHSQAYTLGLQSLRPLRGGQLQLLGELTYAEPSPSLRVRPASAPFTSAAVPQGWTHEGQSLGPAIGPGASSQFALVEWHGAWRGRDLRVGGSLGRVRWDNGVLFTNLVPQVKREDVTLHAAVRGAMRIGPVVALVEFSRQSRFNYLYQAYLRDPATGTTEGVDLANRTLSVTLTPATRDAFLPR
ncbi:MAG: hypothetical protein P3A32_07455 [Gemmatimonadota bacterium]|nr:hypothetical protein [Gemmatimonadota bacterium]MDQ8147955.1 hypothetical protein [Gemmatimonadota bacterium]MDQ8149640.1 hypothetical protein [Gemmatimonadota bacterium]MDQ8177304.1 hypothetical protein [Gemmatimonadota bacterium]